MARSRAADERGIRLVEVSTYDHRNRVVRSGHRHPTWDQVQDAIRSLDGGRCSEMVIEASNASLLIIGGGQGRFHVQLTNP